MTGALIKRLPKVDKTKAGWPWTEETFIENYRQDLIYPKITIVTPSFNQGRYLEETIRSVLLQNYPNIEYFVIDGGSTDESVEVIRNYANFLDYWVSEEDRGQADAINKGFDKATGEILYWLNSDDILLPGALKMVGEAYLKYPEKVIVGNVVNFWEDGSEAPIVQKNVDFFNMLTQIKFSSWHQPGIFVPAHINAKVNDLNENYRYAFDLDWILQILNLSEVFYLSEFVSKFRLHPNSKTVGEKSKWYVETEAVRSTYLSKIDGYGESYQGAITYLKRAQSAAGSVGGFRGNINAIKLLFKALSFDKRILKTNLFKRVTLRILIPNNLANTLKKIRYQYKGY